MVVEAEKGRESREVEASHGHVEREQKGMGRERGSKRQEREREARGPFYNGAGLPGCCQVTMGRSIPGCCQVTVRAEFRQNANIQSLY